MGKELAVQGCTFKASLTSGSITANCSATSQPANDVLVSNKGVYFNKVTVQVPTGSRVTLPAPPSGATSPSGQLMTPGSIDITGTGSNILRSSQKAVLKGDNGSKSLTFTFPGPNGSQVPSPVTVKVEVDNPGQTDVIAL